MIRFLSFILVLILGATAPAWLFAFGVIVYGFAFTGVELIALAVFVDAYFMHGAVTVPMYTIGTLALLVVVELVKPYLLLYNQT